MSGKCDIENPFVYALEPDESASLVPCSVRTENETLPDSAVEVINKKGKVEVTTKYTLKEYGYGKDYIGQERLIPLNLEQFNFSVHEAGTYTLSVEFVYQNITLASVSTEVLFEEAPNVTNITNISYAPILLKDIPDITILKNTPYSFDLADYFTDPDNDSLEFSADRVENISIRFENSTVIIVPDENFTGSRQTKFYASDGENITESNLVTINVVEAQNYTIQVINKKGEVVDELSVNESKVKVKLNKFEEAGKEIIDLTTEENENESEESEGKEEENMEKEVTGFLILENKKEYSSTINFVVLANLTLIQIDKPTEKQQKQGIVTDIIAVEPNEVEVEGAEIILKKIAAMNVTKIGYCSDWDVKKFECDGEWQFTEIGFEQDNETVRFNVSSFSAYAGFTELPEGMAIKLVSNTEQCLVDCEAVLDIYIPESLFNITNETKGKAVQEKKLKLNEIVERDSRLVNEKKAMLKEKKKLIIDEENWLDTDLFDLWFLRTVKSQGIEEFSVEKQVIVTKEKTVFDYEYCGESPTTPGAKKLCVRGNHKEYYNVSEWRDLLEEGFSPGHNIIRIKGKKAATLGENNVDWKIALNISGYQEPNLAWWNATWSRRVPIIVYNSQAENYSVRVNLSYDSDMQSDFDDLRFVDDDNVTELSYWVQDKSDNRWAIVWIKVKDSTFFENQTIYMYYGNSRATSKSNISTTFLFGDDFNDGVIRPEWMNNTGPIYEANGIIFMNTSSGTDVAKLYINTTDGIIYDFAIMVKMRPDYFGSDKRMGLAAKHEWNGSGDGYNFLVKYDNASAITFLDDWVAWGNEASPGFAFSEGNWYWMEFYMPFSLMGDELYGRAWQVGSARPDWQVSQTGWSGRSGATAGINLGYDSYASFDDFSLRYVSQWEPVVYIITTQESANLVVNQSSPACITGEAYYSTIQAAINAATNGSSITVCPGTYIENVKVNKTGVKLIAYSSNLNDTIVQPTSTSNDAFEITVNSSLIKGFTIRNPRYGVYVNGNYWFNEIYDINVSSINNHGISLNGARNTIINNVTIYNISSSSANGIYIFSGANNSIMNCNINTSADGIYIHSAHNNTIRNCNINTTNNGIYLAYSNDNLIENSRIRSVRDGILFHTTNYRNAANNNTINVTGSYYGINVWGGEDNNITNNIILRALQGIRIQSSRVRTINNTIFNATEYGIYISGSENNTLQQNQINNSRYGIYIDGSDRWDFNHSIDTTNLVNGLPIYYFNNYASNIDCNALNQAALSNTNVTAGDIGKITIANSQNIVVQNCNISNENQLGNGVALVYSNNISVRNSNFTNNQYTVYLEGTNNSNVSNVMSAGFKGIYVFGYSYNNTIENSRINATGSGGYGIYLYNYVNGTTVKNNEIRTTYDKGLYINQYSMNNTIINNNITVVSTTSISGVDVVSNSHYGNFSNNIVNITCNGNCYGLYLNANNCTLDKTIVYLGHVGGYNQYGIYLSSVSDSVVNNSLIVYNTTGSNGRGIILTGSSFRNIINNNTIYLNGSGGYGFELSSSNNNFTNNKVFVMGTNSRGIQMSGTTANSTFVNNIITTNLSNVGSWAIYSDNVNNINNTFINTTIKGDNASADVNVSFRYGGQIALKGVATSARPSNPGGYGNISKYINATNLSSGSWLFLNVSYNDLDVSLVDENSLFMARHNGTWETNTSKFASSFGVDTTNNYVYANITNFSTFAPLGNPRAGCIGMNYVFKCGDKINESCTLNANLSINGSTCLEIDADNIVVDGAGYTLTGNDTVGTFGVYIGSQNNVTVKNFTVKDFGCGICEYSSINCTVTDIIALSNNHSGIGFQYGSGNNYSRIVMDSNNYGIYFDGTWNNLVMDSIITNSGTADVASITSNGEPNNTLLNVSFNKSKVGVSSGEIWIKWYLDAYVNDTNGNPVDNATVYAWDNKGTLAFTAITKSGALPNYKQTTTCGNKTINMSGNVLLLHLDEPSGTIYDYSGENNHGTNYGATYNAPGKYNYSLSFDGVNDYLEVQDSSSLRTNTTFTVEAWAFVKGLPPGGADHVPVVWRGTNIGWSSDYTFRIAIRSNGAVTWGSGGENGVEYYLDGGTVADKLNQWVHFVYVANGSSLKGYINGVEVASRTATPPYKTVGFKTYLGWANRNGVNVYFNGSVDEVAIYNRALSSGEILDRYNGGIIGCIDRQNVTEYYQNTTGRFFFTNYSMKAVKGSLSSQIEYVNLTNNKINEQQVVLTLSPCPYYLNSNTVLNKNYSCPGTVFVINASNIVLDCNGYTISYSNSEEGYGIDNSGGFDNITIKNCTIIQGNQNIQGFNIFLNNSDNSTIEYNNLTRGKGGILAINSLNLKIRHNYGSYFEYGESLEWNVCEPFNNTAPYKYFESAIWLVDSNNATIFNNTIQGNISEYG
ncbi:MAG: DUF2341 domain-containing protein, partial [Candidatus Pacearchaeota archaeon]|nr:DUF2341 domain-containing protein [Candidatus Pacearchaeota archaeon]